jgi:hypothetical protein
MVKISDFKVSIHINVKIPNSSVFGYCFMLGIVSFEVNFSG